MGGDAMTATTAQVRSGFAALRELCDPLGHPLLDELERACLLAVTGCDTMADAIRRLQEREIRKDDEPFAKATECAKCFGIVEIPITATWPERCPHCKEIYWLPTKASGLRDRIAAYRMTGQDAA